MLAMKAATHPINSNRKKASVSVQPNILNGF
jgi:hypothetical protein